VRWLPRAKRQHAHGLALPEGGVEQKIIEIGHVIRGINRFTQSNGWDKLLEPRGGCYLAGEYLAPALTEHRKYRVLKLRIKGTNHTHLRLHFGANFAKIIITFNIIWLSTWIAPNCRTTPQHYYQISHSYRAPAESPQPPANPLLRQANWRASQFFIATIMAIWPNSACEDS
jgi:hypothetical protein